MLLESSETIKVAILAYNNTNPKKIPLDAQIDHKTLYLLSTGPDFTFQTLLKSTTPYHEPKKQFIPTKKYLELMQTAQNIIDQKEYNEITKNFNVQKNDWKLVNNQITAIFNVLVSIGAVFASVFYLGGMYGVDLGFRVLFSLLGALVVCVAEGWFFTRDLFKAERLE
jgi:hypothetical protein